MALTFPWSDTFTEASDVTLTSHTPDGGGAWLRVFGGSAPANFISVNAAGDYAVGDDTVTNPRYILNDVAPSADYEIEAVIQVTTILNTSALPAIYARCTGSSGGDNLDGYYFRYAGSATAGNRAWQLLKLTGGGVSETLLDSDPEQISLNTDYTIKLRVSGSTLEGYVNGVLRCSATDSNLSSAGTVGIGCRANGKIFSITAADLAAGETVVGADAPLCAAWLGSSARESGLPAESLARIERGAALPAARLAIVIGGAALPADGLGGLARLIALPGSWPGAVARGAALPAEWAGTLLIAADGVLPAGWLGRTARDGGLGLGWDAGLARGAAAPAEGLGGADRPVAAPAGWQGGVDHRAVLPAAWSGTVVVAIDRDGALPVEFLAGLMRAGALPADWAGTLTIAADGAAPAEWRALLQRSGHVPAEARAGLSAGAAAPAERLGGARRDADAPAGWTGALIVAAEPPAEWTAGLELDRAAVDEWLAAVAGADAAPPAGWTAIVAVGGSAPAEWDGALLLAPRGRLLLARGDAVRVIGARVVLHPAGGPAVRRLH